MLYLMGAQMVVIVHQLQMTQGGQMDLLRSRVVKQSQGEELGTKENKFRLTIWTQMKVLPEGAMSSRFQLQSQKL